MGNEMNQLGLLMGLYGAFLITFYLVKPYDNYGDSRISDLLFGIMFLCVSPILICFKELIYPYYNNIIIGITILHGLGQIGSKMKYGIIGKILQIINGTILLLFAFLILNLFKIDLFNNIESYYWVGLAVVGLDIVIMIAVRIVPRPDFVNENVRIRYGSEEDRIYYEKKPKVHNQEVIDLTQLYRNSLREGVENK